MTPPNSATAPAQPPPTPRLLHSPGAATARSAGRHAPPLVTQGCHKHADTSSSDTSQTETHSGQRRRACEPASRSHDDSRSDACSDHAAAASAAPTSPRTTPRSPPRQSEPPHAPRSTAPAPSRCCAAPESCCLDEHAPDAVPATPSATPANFANKTTRSSTPPDAPRYAARPTLAETFRTPADSQSPGCHAIATLAPPPPSNDDDSARNPRSRARSPDSSPHLPGHSATTTPHTSP